MTSLRITCELFILCEKICFISKLHSTNWKEYYFNFFTSKHVKYFFLMELRIFQYVNRYRLLSIKNYKSFINNIEKSNKIIKTVIKKSIDLKNILT